MKKLKLFFLSAGMLICFVAAGADSHVFSSGRLLEVSTEEHPDAKHPQTRAVYTVQAEGMVYTVRGERVKLHTKDYAKGLIIGDPVEVRVEGEHVFLREPNGKEMKTEIIKRARVQGQ